MHTFRNESISRNSPEGRRVLALHHSHWCFEKILAEFPDIPRPARDAMYQRIEQANYEYYGVSSY